MSEENKNIVFEKKETKNKTENPHSTGDVGVDAEIRRIIERRSRVLAHARKDNFIISHPHTQPFLNDNHRIECLLPYHVFEQGTPEDFLFESTKYDKVERSVENILKGIAAAIHEIESDFENNTDMVMDLMDLEAHKYILNKYTELVDKKKAPRGEKKKVVEEVLPRRSETRKGAVIRLKIDNKDYESHKYVRAVNGMLFFSRNQES